MMADVGKTLITLATYNEIDNLPRLVEEIFRYVPEADVLVIDDNSPDGTGDWCDEKAASDPRVRCLHRESKMGLGTATIAGMQYAIDHEYAQMIMMDADFSHQPKYLPDLLAGMQSDATETVDVMIGSRYVAGGAIEGWGIKRHFMSRAVNLYARSMLGLSPRDCSGAFRCYRTSVLARLNFAQFLSRGYSFQEEVLWHLKRVGCRFSETPITFVDRVEGQSKINLTEAFSALLVIVRLAIKNIFSRSPSHGSS